MAQTNGQDLSPDRRFARNFVLHHKLTPPVDVEALLGARALVEYEDLPENWEAILLRRAGRPPTVLVDRRVHATRLRFTLAHELGHVLLPWQFGLALCDVVKTGGSPLDAADGPDVEAEANRFASEVLLPRSWLAEQAPAEQDDPTEVISEISSLAGVSPITTSLALADLYRIPTASWITMPNGVKYVVQSAGCTLPRNASWWTDLAALQRVGNVYSRSIGHGRTLHCVTFGAASRDSKRPSRTKREVLDEMLQGWPTNAVQATRASIAGIIGDANKHAAGSSAGEIEHVLRARFLGRHGSILKIANHALFDEFIAAAAHDLATKRKNG